MLKQFLEFVKKEKLFSSSEKILLAVSGGVDSVVMCRLFHRAGFKFGIAHCNFKLRGKESDEDEKMVRAIAKKYKVPFYASSFETNAYAREKNISIQMAARELRYSFFEEVSNKNKYDYIATAHHKGDVMETMLMNLTKGTGISGLHGILPKRDKIIRPLLFATKAEIKKFAMENKIPYREDSSNQSEKYQRNLIRNKIIPMLKQINPEVEKAFYQTALRTRWAENFLFDFVDSFRDFNVTEDDGKIFIPIDAVVSLDWGEAILFELLKPYGFTSDVVVQIFESADANSGKKFFSPSYVLIRDRNNFIIELIREKVPEKVIQIKNIPAKIIAGKIEFNFSVKDKRHFIIPKSSEISCLDLEKLKFPLTLRTWKPGDRFHPLGMKTHKKISDFLVDIKMPVNEKENVKVLVSNNKIVCLPSLRIDEYYKVTERTKKVVVITESN